MSASCYRLPSLHPRPPPPRSSSLPQRPTWLPLPLAPLRSPPPVAAACHTLSLPPRTLGRTLLAPLLLLPVPSYPPVLWPQLPDRLAAHPCLHQPAAGRQSRRGHHHCSCSSHDHSHCPSSKHHAHHRHRLQHSHYRSYHHHRHHHPRRYSRMCGRQHRRRRRPHPLYSHHRSSNSSNSHRPSHHKNKRRPHGL